MSKTRLRVAVAAIVCVFAGLAVAAQQPVRDTKAATQQQQTPATGEISGTVVTADAGRPVTRARVMVSGGSTRVARTAQTDDQGAFRFTGLPAGQYDLTATKGGFLSTSYGQKVPGSGRPGTPIQLAANQQLNRLAVPLSRGGVITGRVVEETGEPAFGTPVRAFRWIMRSGTRTLQAAASATTDDRGVYRIPALLPGEYVVSVTPRTGGSIEPRAAFDLAQSYLKTMDTLAVEPKAITLRLDGKGVVVGSVVDEVSAPPATGLATMFYPGAMQVAAATSILVAPGEERGGIDFQLQMVPIGRVSGVVIGPDGPADRADVQLIDPSAPPGFGSQGAHTDREGKFSFQGIAPGQYTLFARATPKGGQPLEASGREAAEFLVHLDEQRAASASQALTAELEKKLAVAAAAIGQAAQLWATTDVASDGRDLAGVQLMLQPGMTMTGQVLLEGGTGAPPSLTRLSLTVQPVGQQALGDMAMPPPAPVDANGRFTIRGLMPGRYRIAAAGGTPSGFTLRSAIFGGQDTLDIPIELTGRENPTGGLVTFTGRTTEIGGAVQDNSNAPATGVTVIAYPAEERLWTPQSRRIQTARPATDGRYAFRNLPPGDYRLIAVADVEPGQWFDPAYLRTLAGFATVSLGDGARLTQDFRVR